MRDQQGKLASKGMVLSSPPIRIPTRVSELEKENVGPDASRMTNVNKTTRPAHLTISVTMSEGDDDNCAAYQTNLHQSLGGDSVEHNSVEDGGSPNVSVWAMMEHYQDFSKDDSNQHEITTSFNPSHGYSEVPHMTTGKRSISVVPSVESNSGAYASAEEDSFGGENSAVEEQEASSVEATKTPTRIHWLEDENGELVQNSYYTLEGASLVVSAASSNESVENDNSSIGEQLFVVQGVTNQERDRSNVFRHGTTHIFDHEGESGLTNSPNPKLHRGQPTPARVRKEWNQESADDDLSSQPMSLLQESIIRSTHDASSAISGQIPLLEVAGTPEAKCFTNSLPCILNDSQLSMASLQGSDPDDEELHAESESTKHALVLVPPYTSMQQIGPLIPHEEPQDETNFKYLARIEELERNLCAQRNNTESVQSLLKDRVVELEQALKVTAATPRGTVVEQNPLKTLLDRNQTLVKEVRFADQTCVELSSKISTLQAQNKIFQQQIATFEQEKENLREQQQAQEDAASHKYQEQEAKIEQLTKELHLALETLRNKDRDEETLCTIIHEVVRFEKADEECDVGLSLATSILSEAETFVRDSVPGNKSHLGAACPLIQRAKVLQKQVKMLAEKANQAFRIEADQVDVEKLRHENRNMKSELDRLYRTASHPSDIESVVTDASRELSQSLSEIDFLRRQLAKVHQKLDEAQRELDNERLRSDILERHLTQAAETYTRLIEPLERRLLEITNSPSAKGVAGVDKHLLSLEKDLAHIKSCIHAIKHESDRIVSRTAQQNFLPGQDQDIVSVVHAAMLRMVQRYKQLELDVDGIVMDFSKKLQKLTEAVTFLRSNLDFDVETVSPEEVITENLRSDDFQDKNVTGMINATIESNRFMDDDDELYELMEEARCSRPERADISSDTDDVSRLFCDDITLESIAKSGSVMSSVSCAETWKAPLEAAIQECQRVRERSLTLKEKIEFQNAAIERLEEENGRLSLDSARRNEENKLIECALYEAKAEIDELRTSVQTIENEKESQLHLCHEKEARILESQLAIEDLSEELNLLKKQKADLECRSLQLDTQIYDLKHELEFATRSSDEYKRQSEEFKFQLSTVAVQIAKKNDQEMNEIRSALRLVQQEAAEAKLSLNETLSKLARQTTDKSKLEIQVCELQQFNARLLSDAEDRDLESQFAREEIRQERAELKTLLAKKEGEVSSLKDSLSVFKAKVHAQLNEKESLIEKLQLQQAGFGSNIKVLREVRGDFFAILSDLGFQEVTTGIAFESETNDPFSLINAEIDTWKTFIPRLGDEIKAVHQTIAELQSMKNEITDMDTELTKHKLNEADWMQQLDDEKTQNEKLWTLLRQAEQEMERSTHQIHQMSSSMTILQQREHNATKKAESLGEELNQVKIDLDTSTIERSHEFDKLKAELSETTASLANVERLLPERASQL